MEKEITHRALELGFDLIGFTTGSLDPKYMQQYKKWLQQGFQAGMAYMQKPRITDSNSVIVLAKNYYLDQQPLAKNAGRIARYAYGRDYHKTIGKALKQLVKFLEPHDPEARASVDTAPVLERAYAEQSGIGFIGKNACLITREFGSWVFLATIRTSLKLNPGTPAKSLCGRCTKCLDACPTKAIKEPGLVDSNLCISYQTIESRGEVISSVKTQIKKTRRIFGCDICQEVCPHNLAKQKPTPVQKIAGDQLSQVPKTDDEFLETFAGSPLMRAKRSGLDRNFNL